MSRLTTFLFGMAAGAALLYVAMHHHLVRANDGLHLVVKQPPHLSEVYIDVRKFGVSDWTARPQLVAALVQANKRHLLEDAAVGAALEGANQWLPNWPD